MIEIANVENEKQIKKLMKEKSITRDEAQDILIDVLFKLMPKQQAKETIKLLEGQEIKCDILDKIKQDLERR